MKVQMQQSVQNLLMDLTQILNDKGFTVGFAESCTGGLLSSELTKRPGVSKFFKGSVICYANEIKERILGVSPVTLQKFGAVSPQCAVELASGTLRALSVDVAVAITGIAGPNGGTAAKPVGTVYIAVAGGDRASEFFHHDFFKLDQREAIQWASVEKAVEHLIEYLKKMKV